MLRGDDASLDRKSLQVLSAFVVTVDPHPQTSTDPLGQMSTPPRGVLTPRGAALQRLPFHIELDTRGLQRRETQTVFVDVWQSGRSDPFMALCHSRRNDGPRGIKCGLMVRFLLELP